MTELKLQRMRLDHADKIDAEFGRHYYMCPRCNHNADYFIGGTENWWCAEAPNYCPNCGCKMQGRTDR